jgi:signal transduction histidine kinase
MPEIVTVPSPDPDAAKRILVVDDDFATLETLGEVLTDHGYQVETAADGRAALATLRSGGADLIILDLMMPIMNGWQFRAAQRADPELRDIPVIAISADGSEQAAAIHADQYLRKPFRSEELLLSIERAFIARERQRLSDRLRQAERTALLGTVAAGVGHDINNPLTYILGNLQILTTELPALIADGPREDREALLARAQGLVADIITGADRIAEVVRSLRWLSRPTEVDHRPLDLAQVLESSIAIAFNEIRHRARLESDLQRTPPLCVLGDGARLGQVFVNLLVNAAQSIPAGAVEENLIRVRTSIRGDQVAVEISDTGSGISPELQQKIFEPFFTTKDPAIGTGLGLTISRNIVREHGGRIELETAPGRGTVFRILLPPAPHDRVDVPAPAATAPAPATSKTRVLVIDDDPLVLKAVARILETGSTVVAAASAPEALEKLQNDRAFDAILCDLMMPEMTGMDLHARVLTLDPILARRIVFMTGGAFAPEAREFLLRSRAVCLDKPFVPSGLRAAVRAVSSSSS